MSLISIVGRCRHLFYLMPFILVLSTSALVYMCDEVPAPPYPTMVDILHVFRVACTCITIGVPTTHTCTWIIHTCIHTTITISARSGTGAVWLATAGVVVVWATDWKVIMARIPYIKGRYPPPSANSDD